VGGVTDLQALTQMIMAAIYPSQMVLGEDLTQATPEYIANALNSEIIAINQDQPFVGPGRRIVGSDLTWPCNDLPPDAVFGVQALACEDGNAAQIWTLNSTDNTIRLANRPADAPAALTYIGCSTEDGTLAYLTSDLGQPCTNWTHDPSTQRIIDQTSGKCLDEYMYTTPRVDLWTCVDGAQNEQWTLNSAGQLVAQQSGFCLTATSPSSAGACTNVWSRPLSDGSVAMAMLNNGGSSSLVTCDAACFAAAGLSSASSLKVRDIVNHVDLPALSPPFNLVSNVTGLGGASGFRITPQ
jgi:hypothetical protein